MKPYFFLFIFSFFSILANGQKGNMEQKEAIAKLRWMVGNWSGYSTVTVDGEKLITNIRESIQPGLDGTILLINVWATDKDSNTNRQSLAYSAFSVISYNKNEDKYRWTTWRNNGNDYDEHSFKVGDQSFEYTSEENGGKTRYKAHLGSKGEFLETGEYSKKGDEWEQFIIMTLYKRKQ